MKLIRILSTVLIFWNTLGILVLLWRYNTNTTTKTFVRSQQQVIMADRRGVDLRGGEEDAGPRVNIRVPRNLIGDRKFCSDNLNVPSIYYNASLSNRKMSIGVRGKRPLSFPRLQDIQFNNVYWQTFEATNGATYFLYSAYYDDREVDGARPNSWVRIISMVDVAPPPLQIRCALWLQNGERMAWATAVTVEHLWNAGWGVVRNGTLQPCLISCLIPRKLRGLNSNKIPDMVSLMNDTQFRPTTNLRVRRHVDDHRQHRSSKKDFVVCVKGLEFPDREDLAVRLLEWVHLLRLLGADRVFVYELDVHPTVARLLDYLQSKDMVKVVPLTLPGNQPNMPELRSLFLSKSIAKKRLNEIIPYNDCLYRNMDAYRYVVLLDIDEVIMPLKSVSWAGLVRQIQTAITVNKRTGHHARRAASYNVRNVYFFDDLEDVVDDGRVDQMDDVPEYLHMSRHVVRSSKFSKRGLYVKCFHDTECVRSLHNHFPFSCLPRCHPCVTYDVDTELAELQHYRADCHDMNVTDCQAQFKNDTVLDLSVRRFSDQLKERVSGDMEALQLKFNRGKLER